MYPVYFPIKYLPIVVQNKATGARYRLMGCIIASVSHVYYIDLATRTRYDNETTTFSPDAMLRKNTISLSYQDDTNTGGRYHYVLEDASVLLYTRDAL
jgi:hypothetical protein